MKNNNIHYILSALLFISAMIYTTSCNNNRLKPDNTRQDMLDGDDSRRQDHDSIDRLLNEEGGSPPDTLPDDRDNTRMEHNR